MRASVRTRRALRFHGSEIQSSFGIWFPSPPRSPHFPPSPTGPTLALVANTRRWAGRTQYEGAQPWWEHGISRSGKAGQSTRTSLRRGGHKTARLQAQPRRRKNEAAHVRADTQPGGVRGKGVTEGEFSTTSSRDEKQVDYSSSARMAHLTSESGISPSCYTYKGGGKCRQGHHGPPKPR